MKIEVAIKLIEGKLLRGGYTLSSPSWQTLKTAALAQQTNNKKSTPFDYCLGCHHNRHTCMQKQCVNGSERC
jgi:hypothetical protein